MRVLVTGAAGFIGMHTSIRLLESGYEVVGFDNLNDYYDVVLKKSRLSILGKHKRFSFVNGDISDRKCLEKVFLDGGFDRVVHLAAQAGVRYSIENPSAYITSNIVGFSNILEVCRSVGVKHLVYASSSSVYGGNKKQPFSEIDQVDTPVSLYAATKKSNELMAHSYSHLFGMKTTGLRFFTVYGPWGRPDMSPWLFSDAIIKNVPIRIFNHGKMRRDFTYIDDIVDGVVRILDESNWKGPKASTLYNIFNIGNNEPIELMHFIEILERSLDKKSKKIMLDMQPGDVEETYADIESINSEIGFKPAVDIEKGLAIWSDWFKKYHNM